MLKKYEERPEKSSKPLKKGDFTHMKKNDRDWLQNSGLADLLIKKDK